MLASISWQHYLTAVVTITGTFYFYIALRYYQVEIAAFLKGKTKTSGNFLARATGSDDVLGKAKQEPFITTTDDSNLIYSDLSLKENKPEIISSIQKSEPEAQVNLTDKLEEDLENLINATKNSEDKNGFLSRLNALINSFKRDNPNINLSPVIDWVIEHANEKLPFPITSNDIQQIAN